MLRVAILWSDINRSYPIVMVFWLYSVKCYFRVTFYTHLRVVISGIDYGNLFSPGLRICIDKSVSASEEHASPPCCSSLTPGSV